jgi:hypothetical protein
MLDTSQVCTLDLRLDTKVLYEATFEIALRWAILLACESDNAWR